MTKKMIIITAVAGLTSFGGAFGVAWLTRPVQPPQPESTQQVAGDVQTGGLMPPQADAAGQTGADSMRTLTEKQLKELIYEVREKIRQYQDKFESLETREKRLQMAQESLRQDVEELNELQVGLASAIANLKSERDRLLQSRVEIAAQEKVNLTAIAATYDKMDPASAGEIITNMCMGNTQTLTTTGQNVGLEDAVKILHYMTERTKAKVLAELVTAQPTLAAVLVQKLKQIAESS